MNSNTFTYSLTNETLDIKAEDSIYALSIVCTSETQGTIRGNAKLRTISSIAIPTEQNQPITISSQNMPLVVTIVAPSGCTILVLASS